MPACSCYETRHARDQTLATHRHVGAYAALVLDGAHHETSVDGTIACEPGTLLLHPRFHAHGNRFGRHGARVVNLALEDDFGTDRVRAFRVDLRLAHDALRRGDAVELTALVADAEIAVAEHPGWQAEMLQALRASDASIGAIAARLGVSAALASRALQRSHGMGPQALRRELRWRHALGLLHGDAPLCDVAAQAGFADQSHFNRVARACSGMTPAQLRRQIKSVQDHARAIAA